MTDWRAKMKLNNEQQRFVEASDKKVLVSANAGSGKTSTMITKIMDIIAGGDSLNNIMAVTFTNAAANDIRQKLFDRLLEQMQKTAGAERERLSDELDSINTASIGTLHAICKKIIEKYYYVIDMNPGFSVATGGLLDNLKDLAIQHLVNQINAGEDKRFYPLFERFNGKRNLTKLYSLAYSLNDFLNALVDQEDWLKEQNKDTDFYFNFILNSSKQRIQGIYKEICIKLNQAKDLDIKLLVEYYGNAAASFDALLSSKTFEELVKRISETSLVCVGRSRKGLEDVKYLIDEASAFHAELKKELLNLKKDVVADDIDLLRKYGDESRKTIDLLVEFVLAFQKEFAEVKKERKVVDFNDFENLAYKILQNETVAEEIKSRYKYIFVDEYQDINYKQDAIIAKMSSGKNVFMIGDVKQCIYTFRQTTPEIFLEKYHRYYDDGKDNELICFNKNYRSQPEILSFANNVFNELITEDTVGVDYKNQAQLETDKRMEEDDLPKVKMILMDKAAVKEDYEMDSSDFFEQEGKMIVKEIASLVENGYYLDGDQKKKINYGDIALLFRDQKDNVQALYKQLSLSGIPVSVKLNKTIFDCPQVIQTISLMKVLNNSFDDYSLATVMLSPVCGCSEQELADVAINNENKLRFYELALQSNNIKIKNLFEKLSQYRKDLLKSTVGELLENVLEKHDLFNIWLSFPDGASIVTKVREFLNLVNSCVDKYSLSAVLDFIDIQMEDGSASKIYMGSSENSVKIMTIHESKGLEYPVVFLCSVGKNFNDNSKKSEMIVTRDLGIGLQAVDLAERAVHETVQHRAAIIAKTKEEMDEQVRLLYVALTRPRNILRIAGAYDFKKIKNFSNKVDKSIYRCKNTLELLLKTMSKEEIAKLSSHIPTKIASGCLVETVSDLEEDFIKNGEILLSAGERELETLLRKSYEFKYPTSAAIATKNTVSSILNEESHYTNSYAVKDFELKSLTKAEDSAEIGTKYHAVMEKLTYNESLKEIEDLVFDVFGKKDDRVISEIFKAVNVLKGIVSDKKIYKEAQFLMCDEYNQFVTQSDVSEKVLVQGVVDLIVLDHDKAIIIDFKTNRGRNEEYFKRTYGLQLDLYAKAVKDGLKINSINKYIYSFDLGKLLQM